MELFTGGRDDIIIIIKKSDIRLTVNKNVFGASLNRIITIFIVIIIIIINIIILVIIVVIVVLVAVVMLEYCTVVYISAHLANSRFK